MRVWIATVDNIGNHSEDPFFSVYVAKTKLGLCGKLYPYVLDNILGSRGVGSIEELDEEDQEIFYAVGIGNRRITRTKAEVVQNYFHDSDADNMKMWSEDLDSKG